MNNWQDLSRLPRSDEYWQQLGARVEAAALPYLAQPRNDKWLLRGGWLAAAAIAASVVVMLSADPPASDTEVAWFTPADPVATQMLNAAAPPSVLQMVSALSQAESQ